MILLDTPLRDSDGDGRIILSDTTADRLGVSRGCVLLPQGKQGERYAYQVEGEEPARERIASPVVTPPQGFTRQQTTPAFVGQGGERKLFSAKGLSAVFKSKREATVEGLTLSDITLDQVGILFRAYGGPLSRVLIERVDMVGKYAGGVGRGIFMANGPVNDIVVRSCRFISDDPITTTGDVYPAVGLAGKTTNDVGAGFLFEDLDLEGFTVLYSGADATKFPNSDGISIEAGYSDGIIRRVRIAKAADAAIDLKGARWRVEDFTAEDCHKSLKFWAGGHDGAVRSIRPLGCHIQLATSQERVVDYLQPISDNPRTPLVQFERTGGVVRILELDTSAMPADQVLAKRSADAKPGTCKLILPDREIVV